ncbi:uncharacterized protein LOC143909840 [Arctopsyche grandis]|uniref:uncharacterized protein LOC143909840 n=1 Tax=Arctopsyche grandis TaxID=121162 RepID=UPI00406D8457
MRKMRRMRPRIKLTFIVLAVAFHSITGSGLFPASLNRGKPLGLLTMHAEQLHELSPPIKFLPSMSFSSKPFFPSMQLPLMTLPTIPEEDEEVEAAESAFSIPQFPFDVPFTFPAFPVTNKPKDDEIDTTPSSIPNSPPSDSYVLNMIDPELPALEPGNPVTEKTLNDPSDEIELFEVSATVESIDNFDNIAIVEEQNISPNGESISDVNQGDNIVVPKEESSTKENEKSIKPQDTLEDVINNNQETTTESQIIQVTSENPSGLQLENNTMTFGNMEKTLTTEGSDQNDSENLLVQGLTSPLFNNQSELVTSEIIDMKHNAMPTDQNELLPMSKDDIPTSIENATLIDSITKPEDSSQADQSEPLELPNNVNVSDTKTVQAILLVDENLILSNNNTSITDESISMNIEDQNNMTESIFNESDIHSSTISEGENLTENTTDNPIDETTPVNVQIEDSQIDPVTETNYNIINTDILLSEKNKEITDDISTVEIEPKIEEDGGGETNTLTPEPEDAKVMQKSNPDAQSMSEVNPINIEDESIVQVIPLNAIAKSDESQSTQISENISEFPVQDTNENSNLIETPELKENKLLIFLNETIIQNPTEINIDNTTNMNEDVAFQDSANNISAIDSDSIIIEEINISNKTEEIISGNLKISDIPSENLSNSTEISETIPVTVENKEIDTLTIVDESANKTASQIESDENLSNSTEISETIPVTVENKEIDTLAIADESANKTASQIESDENLSNSTEISETIPVTVENKEIDTLAIVDESANKTASQIESDENLSNSTEISETIPVTVENKEIDTLAIVDESANKTASQIESDENLSNSTEISETIPVTVENKEIDTLAIVDESANKTASEIESDENLSNSTEIPETIPVTVENKEIDTLAIVDESANKTASQIESDENLSNSTEISETIPVTVENKEIDTLAIADESANKTASQIESDENLSNSTEISETIPVTVENKEIDTLAIVDESANKTASQIESDENLSNSTEISETIPVTVENKEIDTLAIVDESANKTASEIESDENLSNSTEIPETIPVTVENKEIDTLAIVDESANKTASQIESDENLSNSTEISETIPVTVENKEIDTLAIVDESANKTASQIESDENLSKSTEISETIPVTVENKEIDTLAIVDESANKTASQIESDEYLSNSTEISETIPVTVENKEIDTLAIVGESENNTASQIESDENDEQTEKNMINQPLLINESLFNSSLSVENLVRPQDIDFDIITADSSNISPNETSIPVIDPISETNNTAENIFEQEQIIDMPFKVPLNNENQTIIEKDKYPNNTIQSNDTLIPASDHILETNNNTENTFKKEQILDMPLNDENQNIIEKDEYPNKNIQSNDTSIPVSDIILETNSTVENSLEKEQIIDMPLKNENQIMIAKEEEHPNNTIQSNEIQMILFEKDLNSISEESSNNDMNSPDSDNDTAESSTEILKYVELSNIDLNKTSLNSNEELKNVTDEIENLAEATTLNVENLEDQNIITYEIPTNSTLELDTVTSQNNFITNPEGIEELQQNATTVDQNTQQDEKEESTSEATEPPKLPIDYNNDKNITEEIPEYIEVLNTTIVDINETALVETSQGIENNEFNIIDISPQLDPLIKDNEDIIIIEEVPIEFNINETTTSDANISEPIENLEATSERQIQVPNIGESLQVKVEMESLLNNTDITINRDFESVLESPIIENLTSNISINETALTDESKDPIPEIILVDETLNENSVNKSSTDVTNEATTEISETSTETKYEIRMFPNIPEKPQDDSEQQVEAEQLKPLEPLQVLITNQTAEEDILKVPNQDVQNLSFLNETDTLSEGTIISSELNIIELTKDGTIEEMQNESSEMSTNSTNLIDDPIENIIDTRADVPNVVEENTTVSDDSQNETLVEIQYVQNADDELTTLSSLESLDIIDLNITDKEMSNILSEPTKLIDVSQNEIKSAQEIENETTTSNILENLDIEGLNTTDKDIKNLTEQNLSKLTSDEKTETEVVQPEIIKEEPISSNSEIENEKLQGAKEESMISQNTTEKTPLDEEIVKINNTTFNLDSDKAIITNITDIERQFTDVHIVTLPIEGVTMEKANEDITLSIEPSNVNLINDLPKQQNETEKIIAETSVEQIVQNVTEIEISQLPTSETLPSLNGETITTLNKTESSANDPQIEILNKIISEIPIDKEAQQVVLQKSNDISNQTVLGLSPSNDDNNSTTVTVMRMYEKLLLKYVFNGPEA